MSYNLLNDVYYQLDYGKLYLEDTHTLFNFEYQEDDQLFKNIAIKKPIHKIGNRTVEGYFDLETPYGYGGYYTNSDEAGFLARALAAYRKRCLAENIIAEFCSFHPFNNFPFKHADAFDLCFQDRKVVVVDLQKSKEERWLDYASKTRTILRKCYKQLQVEESQDIDQFMELYVETMNKNKAKQFYYFDKEYFESLFRLGNIKLISVKLDDIVIAMSFVMLGQDIGHYHLSANKTDYLKYNANYIILEEAFNLAKEAGCKSFHLGGGRSPLPDDTLFRFKRKFSPLEQDFYLAGNVYNREIFDQYIGIWEDQNPNSTIKYFLKYHLDNE